jgi:hypothetical protein
VLVLAHQIDRLTQVALQALETSHDAEAIAVARSALVQVQTLATEMAR